jgi:hypothetical protein
MYLKLCCLYSCNRWLEFVSWRLVGTLGTLDDKIGYAKWVAYSVGLNYFT